MCSKANEQDVRDLFITSARNSVSPEAKNKTPIFTAMLSYSQDMSFVDLAIVDD